MLQWSFPRVVSRRTVHGLMTFAILRHDGLQDRTLGIE